MQLLNPVGLWALAGLFIPVAIHLLSRKEGKVIRIGSLRHLQETNTQQFKGIRLNEVLLLLLRSLMIVIFALLLGNLNFTNSDSGRKTWILIEQGLETEQRVKRYLDSVTQQNAELRWWTTGFPAFVDRVEKRDVNHVELLQQLKSQQFSKATIVSSARMVEFKGQKAIVPENITWLSITPASTQFVVDTIRKGEDFFVRSGYSNERSTYFESLPTNSPAKQDTVLVYVYAQPQYEKQKKLIMDAIITIQRHVSSAIQVREVSSWTGELKNNGCLFWFSDDPVVARGGKVVSIQSRPTKAMLEQREAARWELSKELNVRSMVEQNVLMQLAEMLVENKEAEELADQYDNRTMPAEMLLPDDVATSQVISYRSADRVLISLLFVVLLLERILAHKRNQ